MKTGTKAMLLSLACALWVALAGSGLWGESLAAGEPAGNPVTGASLYEPCVPCHDYTGKGMAGMSESRLVQAMKTYQTIETDKPKLLGMKQALAPLSDQQLRDLAAYISKM